MFTKNSWGGPQGLSEFPPLAIGRLAWDNWLVFWALAWKMDVINASDFILAIHQNHDYSHHPAGTPGVMQGEEAEPISRWPAKSVICTTPTMPTCGSGRTGSLSPPYPPPSCAGA